MINTTNLQRMADYVRTIPQEQFDMYYYRSNAEETNIRECNSIGCILGHCTILDTSVNHAKYIGKGIDNARFSFSQWCESFTGISTNFIGASDRATLNIGQFLFSCQWRFVDNTPEGAAKRLEFVAKDPVSAQELIDNIYETYGKYSPKDGMFEEYLELYT